MPHATQAGRKRLLGNPAAPTTTTLVEIFPPHPKVPRGPLIKQQAVYALIASGATEGGGVIYQGGKGCAKTICGVAADIWVHHYPPWIGCRSLVGRETYPAFLTSTWDEYKSALDRLPPRMIKNYSSPSVNSMGYVEWDVGGVTLFVSLSDEKVWASANLGFVWVDEGHLQQEAIADKLQDRLRQIPGPRTMLITTNPHGQGWIYRLANPRSRFRLPKWFWIESSMFDNPTLPPDYIKRMEAKYPPGTPGHRRWVLGQSAQLEGAAFPMFDADPKSGLHVIPDIAIPAEWSRGRGLDWGLDDPCVAVWGALSPEGDWYIYRTHRDRQKPASWHARRILDLEGEENIQWTPADPEIFRSIHPKGDEMGFFSTADEFYEQRCDVTRANNDRDFGFNIVLDLLTVDPEKTHPITLKQGSPRLFVLNNESNQSLINCLETLETVPEPKTGSRGKPDEVAKRRDHEYDALRYLVAEKPEVAPREPVIRPVRRLLGSRGYVAYG
jgi:hypothetical protein